MLRLCVLLSIAAVLQGTVLGDAAADTAPTGLNASASASPGRFEDSEVCLYLHATQVYAHLHLIPAFWRRGGTFTWLCTS